MSKMDFKKKVCKNENYFFLTFFSYFFTIYGNATCDKIMTETIRKKVKKSDFFGIFWDFLGFFQTKWTTFGQLCTFFG